ncbi:MAG TPA: tRNA preQ1(34) S-adenosylmethionine ribosyltransferase-isomerase QueA [Planctomycetota bacterium]|nr:tRNA preQ1(34) S-adenosylmethionine ribosyltransferase-isomerase QueA [Planctomycetota bacterium]
MRLDELDYDLPPDRIARVPAARREDARLLVCDRASGAVTHDRVPSLPRRLSRGDLLVVNDVRVVPARLGLRRRTGARVEALVVHVGENGIVLLAEGRGRLRAGEALEVEDDPRVAIELVERIGEAWRARAAGVDAAHLLERVGHVPLPPYIRAARRRDGLSERELEPLDRERYQTVFAAGGSAVAAPTAGLHLSESILDELDANGIERAAVRLEVGPATFAPIRGDDLDGHRMEPERYAIGEEAAAHIEAARARGARVVAVGTTVVRTLESVAARDGVVRAGAGEADLFIRPGHRFRAVDALLTNFHLPRSTLLGLVCAFAGVDRTLALYRDAVREGYRFYSYGDAMLLL